MDISMCGSSGEVLRRKFSAEIRRDDEEGTQIV